MGLPSCLSKFRRIVYSVLYLTKKAAIVALKNSAAIFVQHVFSILN